MFHQIEGLMVDRGIKFTHLKGVLSYFIRVFFKKEIKVVFSPSYFPFTEPSAELSISCVICEGKGCSTCTYSGFLEILGCGMVHPNVFKNVGYDPSVYTGFAFGMGVERLAMLKYRIDDIRHFYFPPYEVSKPILKMRYSYKILMNYIVGELAKEKMINYLKILGLNPKIIKEENSDIIFELETPANRPDLLSFTGILREIMPFGNFALRDMDKTTYKEEISDFIPVEIENLNECFYYSCRIIRNIKNSFSTEEFKKSIEDMGFKSSLNVVDISNFVMCEIGQPLHIFDLDKIKGKIIVRKGKKGEKITTIDGKEREVEDVLLIADEEKPIAIAGIMGGANTEVSQQTKNILIESAYFNPVIIRKGSKKIGLITEASLRFEKDLSISMAKKGMERATEMIKEFCGGEIGRLSFKGLELKKEEKEIYLKKENIEKILGLKIEEEFLRKIFDKLNFKIKNEDEKKFLLTIPDYRKDIKEEIDIIEEIAKYKKYSDIPEEMPVINIQPSFVFSKYETIKKIKHLLVNLGFSEVITLSFISDRVVEKFNLEAVKIEIPFLNHFLF
jgi:Phenylalanyl-tRNA synthetase beta subunit